MVPRIRNIVVGVESVRGADPVLERAAELSRALGATLHVVHGYMLTDPLLDAYARAGYLGEQTITNFGRELQSSLEARVAELGGGEGMRAAAVAGPPVGALLEVADSVGADLIVVGSSRHDTFPLSLLGSTCRAVLRRSKIPVLVMRASRAAVPRKVLAPTDLSPLSAAAFRWALAFSDAANGAEFRSLLVINQSLMMLPLEQRLLDRVAEEELGEFTAANTDEGRAVDRVVRRGDPATEILAEAESWGAELLVLGTHARKGMERVLLGSVAETAIKTAPCNVLVVPPDAKGGSKAHSDGAVHGSGEATVPPAV